MDRLGYFKDVNIDTNEVPNSPDQVDLVVNVTERPTRNLMFGVTFSSAERLALNASIRQDNVFGSGNYLGFEVNTSKSQRSLVFSTVDPYYTVDGVSRSLDLYYKTSKPFNSLGDQYQISSPGAAVRFGVPFNDYDTGFFGIGAEQTRIGATSGIPNSYFEYRYRYGPSSSSLPLTVGWARDERDSVLTPTAGRYQRVNLEWSVAGDVRYLLAIEPGMRLLLPPEARFNHWASLPADLLAQRRGIAFPPALPYDLATLPDAAAGIALKLWSGPLPPGAGWAAMRAGNGELRMYWDVAVLPQVACWMNLGAWAVDGGAPYYNLGLEPCIGAQDSLEQAGHDERLFASVAPGASVAWWLELDLIAVPRG